MIVFLFFSSRRRHTRFKCDWSSDVCSSDLDDAIAAAGPEIALHIETNPVGHAGAYLAENATPGELALGPHIEGADVMRAVGIVGKTGIGDIKGLFVRRKRQAVWFHEIVGHHANIAGGRVDTKDEAALLLHRRFVAFVIRHDPVGWV